MSEALDISGRRAKAAVLFAGAFAVLAPLGLLSIGVEDSSKFAALGPDNALKVYGAGAIFLVLYILPLITHGIQITSVQSAARSAAVLIVCAAALLPGMLVCGAYSLSDTGEWFASEAAVLIIAVAASGGAALLGIRIYLPAALTFGAGYAFVIAIFHQFGGSGIGALAMSPFWMACGTPGVGGFAAWTLAAAAFWAAAAIRFKRLAKKNN
jgi:hypothetical protein